MISIHAAREGGDGCKFRAACYSIKISIHAAREGGDDGGKFGKKSVCRFQSTPPVKAATVVHVSAVDAGRISIHAAREGGDLTAPITQMEYAHFNPRRP